jgi:hypothetical protein
VIALGNFLFPTQFYDRHQLQTADTSMTIALSPSRMTAPERLDEIAEILALGAMRLMARKSSSLSPWRGETSLDFTPEQSGHAKPPLSRGENA